MESLFDIALFVAGALAGAAIAYFVARHFHAAHTPRAIGAARATVQRTENQLRMALEGATAQHEAAQARCIELTESLREAFHASKAKDGQLRAAFDEITRRKTEPAPERDAVVR